MNVFVLVLSIFALLFECVCLFSPTMVFGKKSTYLRKKSRHDIRLVYALNTLARRYALSAVSFLVRADTDLCGINHGIIRRSPRQIGLHEHDTQKKRVIHNIVFCQKMRITAKLLHQKLTFLGTESKISAVKFKSFSVPVHSSENIFK